MPVASHKNAHSLIGFDVFADGSLYAGRPNTLGSDCRRLRYRRDGDLGGDAMDRMAAGISAATRSPVVRAGRLADLPSARLLLVVVFLRRLRTCDLHRGRHDRSVGRVHRHRRSHHHVDHPRARDRQRRDLWFGALGRRQGNSRCRPTRSRWRRARPLRARLSPP
ncbi:Conjugal transfer protein trbB [Granulibacter bethesdensis]|nr:Conjugal transfer protein trbB [Granulibacter bethesdensis]